MVPAETPARPVAPQLAILVIAVVIAAAIGATRFAGLALAYAIAWAIVNAAMARGIALPRAPRAWVVIVSVIAVAVPIASLARRRETIADAELLVGLDVHTADRLRLEEIPQIHPAIVLADRPQLFFVHAPGSREATVRLGSFAEVEAEPLGHGVFRVDYDPRRDGSADPGVATIVIAIDVGGRAAHRDARWIVPPPHPRWLRASPDRSRACTTSEETDELLVIAAGRVSRVPVHDGPSDCAWIDDQRIAVSHRYAGSVAIVRDAAIVRDVEVGSAQSRIAAEGMRIAVARELGEVVVIDGLEVTDRVPLASPDWLALDGRTVVVAQREPASLAWIRDHERSAIALRAPAVTMARAGSAVVIATTDHAAPGEDPRAHLGNHYVQDQLLAYDLASHEVVRQIFTAGRSPRQDAAGGLDRGVSPLGIDASPDGTWCVAFAGSDELAIIPPSGETRWIDAARAGLSAPTSCVILADGSIVATSPSSALVAILEPTGRLRTIERLAHDDETLLRDDPDALRVRFGERAFYEGTRAGISCQSCHLHGASDGLLHNIGGRALSPTLDVRGIVGTSPYLRDGSYPRIRDLHVVADELYRGYREPAGDRGATIEAWISTLPPPLPTSPRDPEAERRGLDVFVRAGCPTCHAPPAFTQLGRHPTHAVFPGAEAAPGASLDTPSLRAVSRRSRWLFDGRAGTLSSVVIRWSRGQRHGRVDELDEGEVRDLLTFLESL